MKLKVHNKKVSDYSEIDKLILIPKKMIDDFALGENSLSINGQKLKLRVYDIPCDCSREKHSHRIIDLRDIWDDLRLSEGQEVEIGR